MKSPAAGHDGLLGRESGEAGILWSREVTKKVRKSLIEELRMFSMSLRRLLIVAYR